MGDTNGNGNGGGDRTFTQADIDRIVGERVAAKDADLRALQKQLKIAEEGLGQVPTLQEAARKAAEERDAEKAAHATTRTAREMERALRAAGLGDDEETIEIAQIRYRRATAAIPENERPAFPDWLKRDGVKDPFLARRPFGDGGAQEPGGLAPPKGDPKPDTRPETAKREAFTKYLQSREYMALKPAEARTAREAKKKALGLA